MKQKEIIQRIIITRSINTELKKENIDIKFENLDLWQVIGIITKLQNDLINNKIEFPNQKIKDNIFG